MSPESRPDLRHVEVWLFDLDNTLYPPETEFMGLIEKKMTAFVARETGLAPTEALALQKRYLHEHGTTLAGLMAQHGVDPETFLDEVHDVSLAALTPDPVLKAAIAGLPGRRLVFTNGDARHAERVLEKLDLADQFEATFHIAHADYIPKPAPETFEKMTRAHDVAPRTAAFFEDSVKNLAPAAAIGMTTVLVGPHAEAASADFVHYRTRHLAPFLATARVREIPKP
jgi:putative hydrolase of the HAD superfamily